MKVSIFNQFELNKRTIKQRTVVPIYVIRR